MVLDPAPGSTHNGLYWGEGDSIGNPALVPNTLVAAERGFRLSGPTTFAETDIRFNTAVAAGWNWTGGLIQGIATHEFGHAAGLNHDSSLLPACNSGNPNTMCPGGLVIFDQLAVISLASLETKDISDVNSMY